MNIYYYKLAKSERRFAQIGNKGYIYEIPNCDSFVSSCVEDDFTIIKRNIDSVESLGKYCPKNVVIVPVNIFIFVESGDYQYLKIDEFRFVKLTRKMALSLINFEFFRGFITHTHYNSFEKTLRPSIFDPFSDVSYTDEIKINIAEFPCGILNGALMYMDIRNERSDCYYLSMRDLFWLYKNLNSSIDVVLNDTCKVTKLKTLKEFKQEYNWNRKYGNIKNIVFKVFNSDIIGIESNEYLSIFPVEALQISKFLPPSIVSVEGCVADIIEAKHKNKL